TKKKSSKPGPGIAHMGLFHTFVLGNSLQQTIWLNLLTEADLQSWNIFAKGVGKAPWEKMPEGEDCATAQDLKQSLMGRLVPLCRFCLLKENGIHVTEGLQHLSHKDGMFDPSITLKKPEGKKKERKVIWADPNKRPWRELTGLLSFINGEQDCFQLYFALPRAFKFKPDQQNMYAECGIWSGGFRVSSNAGEQYATGTDDNVEAHYAIPSKEDRGGWFDNFKQEMSELEALAKKLYGSVMHYFKEQNFEGQDLASAATAIFWQLCESQAQALLNDCDNIDEIKKLRQCFSGYLRQTYDQFCFGQTARQLDAWAKCRPNTAKYIELRR
ncbi:MAG: type I-E CRISPR-associated protein Cse1/CasA, partial [Endozoicomonadaceae bacterium]|nr:type I-E CRISPR-associated protein Cse1/CasA [Endozoicomonadaceae bacterium]